MAYYYRGSKDVFGMLGPREQLKLCQAIEGLENSCSYPDYRLAIYLLSGGHGRGIDIRRTWFGRVKDGVRVGLKEYRKTWEWIPAKVP